MASMGDMGAGSGMLIMETIAKIRRAHFAQKKPIKAICREFRVSRKVVRKVILGDIGDVVEDQQVVFVEPGDGGFESEFATGDLQPLDEIGGSREQNAPAVFDEGEAESCRQVTLAPAGRPEQDQIGAHAQPGIAGSERHDLGLADHRDGFEVEGVEGLAGR